MKKGELRFEKKRHFIRVFLEEMYNLSLYQ